MIKHLLKEKNFSNGDMVYVGDEVRDIKAAKKARVRVIAVTWGLNSRKILEKEHPDYLVDRPQELLKIQL